VAGTKQGQQARVRVTQVANRFATGQVVDSSGAMGGGGMTAESSQESGSEE